MRRHYILVEGINLYANIYDTDQLSVIRGSSFLYKEAVEEIADPENKIFKGKLKSLSTGASSGLFQVLSPANAAETTKTVEDFLAENAAKMMGAVEEFLADPDKNYHLLTFAVACTQADTLLEAKEKLLAQIRWQQLNTLTLKADLPNYNAMPCGLSGLRIAGLKDPKKIQSDEKKSISDSMMSRWSVGRDEKQNYYRRLIHCQKLLDRLEKLKFAKDIEALCTDPAQSLNHKMAVFYADGNRFGSRQRAFIEQATTAEDQIERQQTFDDKIQGQRQQFLSETLSRFLPENNETTIRLETLLWGGDEMLFVMPAWQGFDFLQRFFAFNWTLPDGDNDADECLSHAAGIVFCQANTPIRIIQALARDLAEQVKAKKDEQGQEIGRKQNGWDYLVLESVDYPTNESLDDYFTERYGKTLTHIRHPHAVIPAITQWSVQQREQLALFLYGDTERRSSQGNNPPALSRGQLYQVVQAIKTAAGLIDDDGTLSPQDYLDSDTFKQWAAQRRPVSASDETGHINVLNTIATAEQRLYQVSTNQQALDAVLQQQPGTNWFGLDMNKPVQRIWFWIHLLELWDYLVPQPAYNHQQEGTA